MVQNILTFIFKKHLNRLASESEARIKRAEDMFKEKLNQYITSHNTMDIVRERMNMQSKKMLRGMRDEGFDDDEGMLAWVEKDRGGLIEFLAECHKLKENWALPIILDWNTRRLVLFAALKGANMDQINFSRASVNGLELIRDDVVALNSEYEERKNAPKAEDVDIHQAL